MADRMSPIGVCVLRTRSMVACTYSVYLGDNIRPFVIILLVWLKNEDKFCDRL